MGQDILFVENLSKKGLFSNVSFTLKRGDKVAFLSPNSNILNALFAILAGEDEDYEGKFKYGITVTPTYLPTENSKYFEGHTESLVDWLRPYSSDQHESYLRGWLGRMLFSGEEALKPVNVLSGGEKVRCMMAKTMLTAGNLLIMNEPTNHLDLDAITALNKDRKSVV